jgi:hypothetical protein
MRQFPEDAVACGNRPSFFSLKPAPFQLTAPMIFSTLSSAVPRRLSLQGSAGRADARFVRGDRDEYREDFPII